VDPAGLIQAAQEAHVSVHAVCGSSDEEIREICRATGGFYAISENVAKTLSGIYRGLSHRYIAGLTPDTKVRQVQVAVRTEEFSGESPVCELNC
jgi:hypothetical protein